MTHKLPAAGKDPVVSLPAWHMDHVPWNTGLHKDQLVQEQEQVMPSDLLEAHGQVRRNNRWEAEDPRLAAARMHHWVAGDLVADDPVAGSCHLSVVVGSRHLVEGSRHSVAAKDNLEEDIHYSEAEDIRHLVEEGSHCLEEDNLLVVDSLQEVDNLGAVHHSNQLLAEGNMRLVVVGQLAFCGNALR